MRRLEVTQETRNDSEASDVATMHRFPDLLQETVDRLGHDRWVSRDGAKISCLLLALFERM